MARDRGFEIRSPALLDRLMEGRYTNRGLADAVGCSYQMIGHLRSGARASCRPLLAMRIAAALDVPIEVLFNVTDPQHAAADSNVEARV